MNRLGHSNARHNHGAVTLSGVFYVADGVTGQCGDDTNDDDETTTTNNKPPPQRARLRVAVADAGLGGGGNATAASLLGWLPPAHAPAGGGASTVRAPASSAPADVIMVEVVESAQPGTLVLWPGYLDHDVMPHTSGQAPRISIAFNVWVLASANAVD